MTDVRAGQGVEPWMAPSVTSVLRQPTVTPVEHKFIFHYLLALLDEADKRGGVSAGLTSEDYAYLLKSSEPKDVGRVLRELARSGFITV